MTAPVVRMQVSTVAPRPRPAPKGVGRPVGTPLTAARGLRRPARLDHRRPRAGSDVARRRRARGRERPRRHRHRRLRQPRHDRAPRPARAARRRAARRRRSGASGRRCTARRSTSAAAASSCTRSAPSTSRSGTCFGKQLGVPVYELLGGRMRPSLPAYASWLYATEDLDALAAEAAAWAAQGFTAVKQRLAYGPLEGKEGIHRNVELVRTVVDAVGPGRRRDGRRVHELGCRLRDPLHPRDRGCGHPPALDRGAA